MFNLVFERLKYLTFIQICTLKLSMNKINIIDSLILSHVIKVRLLKIAYIIHRDHK
ncbi:hypothetical protein SJAV_12430 [Sulfurisphaera javensis]|uniref:Uncharacterized protein n=1 Tax=Sulfurisphaera javensis TaxID=2049879 RepID=A0AAT9GRI3_9CREN